jgi:hypothetical protein
VKLELSSARINRSVRVRGADGRTKCQKNGVNPWVHATKHREWLELKSSPHLRDHLDPSVKPKTEIQYRIKDGTVVIRHYTRLGNIRKCRGNSSRQILPSRTEGPSARDAVGAPRNAKAAAKHKAKEILNRWQRPCFAR